MKGFNTAEEGHPMILLHPVSYSGATNSDVFSMAKHAHASIIVALGVTDADAGNITVEECTAADGTGATAIEFNYYAEETALGDTLGARTAVATADAATGIDVSANDNIFYVIELDATELSEDSPFVRIALSAPGGAQLGAITAVLSGARYAKEQSATAQS